MTSDEQSARRTLTDSVRKYLSDARLRGLMPENLAASFDRDADKLVGSIVSVLLPGMVARLGKSDGPPSITLNMSDVTMETLQGLAVISQLAKEPLTDAVKNRDGALLFCSRASKYLKDERYKDAKMFFRRAIDIDPGIKSAWLGLADALDHLGESEAASEARALGEKLM